MRRSLVPVVVALGALALSSCAGSAESKSDQRLRIVTTVAPITSIVANVAGDLARIDGLVPEGTNSHTFEPPPSAARVLSLADVVFVNGLKLEDPIAELAEANLSEGAELVSLGDRTVKPDAYLYDFSFPRQGGKPNPHLWTNPPMAKRYAEIVAATLVRRDGRNAERYRANLRRFSAQVDELDVAMKAASATVPVRKLLTYHDAYAYFAQHYGWEVVGAIQPSSFDEPSAREVAQLIGQVKASGVKAIFGSEVFPSPVLAQIGKEAEVTYVDVLRDDDLPGRPGEDAHSWLGLMRFDFITIVEALGGDASTLKAVEVTNVARDTARYPQ